MAGRPGTRVLACALCVLSVRHSFAVDYLAAVLLQLAHLIELIISG
jgi:hypothetical protein